MKRQSLLLLIALQLAACGKTGSSGGVSFPNVEEIVANAAPTTFAASLLARSAPLRPFDQCSSYANSTSIFGCIGTYVLSDSEPSGAIGQWFLHWIQGLDTRLAEIETRSKESDHACLSATTTDVNFLIDSASFDSLSGTTDLSIPMSFSCFDNYDGPDGNPGGGIAFGTKDGETYMMDRSTGNDGVDGVERIISLAKTNADGDEAEIWVLMNGTSANTPSIMRIKGNKTTKAFSYEALAGHNNNYFKYLFLRSNGTKMYIDAADDDGTDLYGMLTSDCVDASDSSASATGCSTDELDLYPTSTFSSSITALSGVSNSANLYDAMDAIRSYDLEASGVAGF